MREHLLPLEPTAALVQNDQVKRLAPKELHSLCEGRTGSHLAPQLLEYGSVVNEIPWIFVEQKDSGPVSGRQFVCQPWAGG
jgi:hypothetical protein